MRRAVSGMSLLLSLAVAACVALAGEPPKGKAKEEPKEGAKGATHTVRPEFFKVEAQFKGAVESPRMAEIIFRPEAWTELVVKEAAAPGTRVKKGDLLLALDTQKIDEALKDAEAALAAMAPALKLAEEDVAATEKLLPLDLAAAERAKKFADEDLRRYTDTDRPMAARQATFSVTHAGNILDYEKEELRQLEQMYKADDLTEETEEIILRRQRDSIERAKFSLDLAKHRADQTLNVDLPRKDIEVKENVTRQAIALAKAKVSLPETLAKKRADLDKLKADRQKAADRLAKLKKDRDTMVVKAPCDGVVYIGPCVRGNWPRLGQTLERGAAVKPHDVVMTVVEPGELLVRAVVPEEQLERVQTGGEAQVVPVGYPALKLKAKLDSVSPVPVTPGNFEAIVSIAVPKGAPALVPGMNASLKLTSYAKKDALVVPAAAIFTEDGDEEATYVYVQTSDGSPKKQPVVVGKKADGKAEILRGLVPGDVVLLERPGK